MAAVQACFAASVCCPTKLCMHAWLPSCSSFGDTAEEASLLLESDKLAVGCLRIWCPKAWAPALPCSAVETPAKAALLLQGSM